MSEVVEGTRGQSPEDIQRVTPAPVFARGDVVPGLNSWVLERELGAGGFGAVWLARHAWNAKENPRAVKFCTDPEARHRLVTHERNVVVRATKYTDDHPNIVPLLDCNLDGDIPWLMYEYVEGGTLADLIAQWRGLPVPERLGRAVQVLHAIAGALAACHRLNPPLVHRDLKPRNVLMAGAVPRVTDFGIGGVAVPPRDAAASGTPTGYSARVPTSLQGAGTANYAPIEQRLGSPPNPRDDVHALGVIAYHMTVGDMQFAPGPDAKDVLRDLNVPDALVALIVNSVAHDPNRRPKDATEWETTLAPFLQKSPEQSDATATDLGSNAVLLPEPPSIPMELPPPLTETLPTAPRPVVEPKRRNRRLPWVITTVLLAVVCVTGIRFATRGKPSDISTPATPETAQVGSSEPKGDGTKGEKAGEVAPKPTEPPKSTPLPNPGETREFPLPDGLKMTFCWVPGGECELGFLRWERGNPDETCENRGKFKTSGFWMGKYEVTQAEWAAVMRRPGAPFTAPSHFRVGGENAFKLGGVTDTSRFPVENVSWNMICDKNGFLESLNARGAREKVFGTAGTFVLPHEDEWEYACRGGMGQWGTKQPFHFGSWLDGTQANVNATIPYGVLGRGGLHLMRPTPVGTYADKYPHPWGLCDMHGNVWEWCSNSHEQKTDSRALRGGSWGQSPTESRAASRSWAPPATCTQDGGFRVCFRPN